MRGFILAAGLGTRLRPFTLDNPKALVPVGGVPMLQRVIERMKGEGISEIVINIHHFGEKIVDFLRANDNFGIKIDISDESDLLRDTGGGLQYALSFFPGDEPVVIHNVDILSNAPLKKIANNHVEAGNKATLIVSPRESSRQLIFSESGKLRGWHNKKEGKFKPSTMTQHSLKEEDLREYAFSGIHIVNPEAIRKEMLRQNREGVFSIIDFYLDSIGHLEVKGELFKEQQFIDIGRPATLSQANELFNT